MIMYNNVILKLLKEVTSILLIIYMIVSHIYNIIIIKFSGGSVGADKRSSTI
jgi:hypothetical protein